MEVSFENDRPPTLSEANQSTIHGLRRSVAEKQAATRSEWLLHGGSDSEIIHRRLDLPQGNLLDEPHSVPGRSVYGHCAPMPVSVSRKAVDARELYEVIHNGSDYTSSNRVRLLRLMEAQQAWYDLHQQAAAQAAEMLSLVEHHQSQWIR